MKKPARNQETDGFSGGAKGPVHREEGRANMAGKTQAKIFSGL
jgi:hypothetical protein